MLRRQGVRVVSITEQAEDTATGRLLEGIIESVDQFYSENFSPLLIDEPCKGIETHVRFQRSELGELPSSLLQPEFIGVSQLDRFGSMNRPDHRILTLEPLDGN